MTPNEYLNSTSRKKIEQMVQKANTTYRNFRMIAAYGGACSAPLARRLELASNFEMTLREILFPEEYEFLTVSEIEQLDEMAIAKAREQVITTRAEITATKKIVRKMLDQKITDKNQSTLIGV